jgi:hypothetical protein
MVTIGSEELHIDTQALKKQEIADSYFANLDFSLLIVTNEMHRREINLIFQLD